MPKRIYTEEQKAARNAAQRAYRNTPEGKARMAKYRAKPEYVAKKSEYSKRADVKAKQAAYDKLNAHKKREAHNAYHSTIRGIVSTSRTNAKTRDIDFQITVEHVEDLILKSGMKCSLSGVPLSLKVGDRHKVSIDRIDSSKGYTVDNIQIVSAIINRMKSDLSQTEFVELSAMVGARLQSRTS